MSLIAQDCAVARPFGRPPLSFPASRQGLIANNALLWNEPDVRGGVAPIWGVRPTVAATARRSVMDMTMAVHESSDDRPAGPADTTAELQNRARNLMARVRSVLRQMAELDAPSANFAAHFDGRLTALWRAEEALAKGSCDLTLQLLDELRGLGLDEDAVTLRGAPIRLDGKAASVLILALHEMTTNAVKYGAFSRQTGQLTVSWRVAKAPTGRRLKFTWVESGVPMLAMAPRHEGFGWDVITRRIAYELGGTGEFVLGAGGVSYRLDIPL